MKQNGSVIMKYSYEKCKKFLKDNNIKVTRSDYIHVEIYGCGDDRLHDKLTKIVEALNSKEEVRLVDFRTDVIYTLLKNNKDKLIEEE